MVRRRLAFAAPFVLVVGCRTPPPVEPGEETADEEGPVVVNQGPPSDAAVSAPPADAATATAPVDAAPPKVTARPRDRSILGEGNPPPPTIRGYMVRYEPMGFDTEVTFDAGTDRGVDPKRATARLLDGETDQPLKNGEIRLAVCTKVSCRGSVKLPPDQVSGNPNVEIRVKDPNAPEPVPAPKPVAIRNPPRPGRGQKPKPTPPPVVPRQARIIATQVEGGVTVIIIGMGTDHGVTVESSDVRVTRGGTEVPGGEVTLTSCMARVCRGTVKLTPEQIKASAPEVTVRQKDPPAP